ncbi:hypothetical protein [Ruegeria sp. PrR005]|uniref:Uncharacterized protein n=1 Tax=Ruegeria sp. PrR005 TaxID=2706882 RepID=A0A6B2NWK0_9RHOB|nr:hypothetical protein [Ruegeria sp. PrR005]NDW46799.1 hypothetical protein [Ruegeria sp. PrR005]
MEPEFLIPVGLLALGLAAGVLLARIGAAIWAVLAALAAVVMAWLLLFHSQLFGWEGMGPGIVGVLFCLPLALGLLGGAGFGCWRRRRG